MLIRPVHRNLAMLMVVFRIISMAIMGISFTARTFLLVLAPGYASPLLLVVAGIVFAALTLWLLVKGVNVEQWRATVQRI